MLGINMGPFEQDIDPGNVVFLSGAGISVDGPTFGPIGNELTYRAIDACFADYTHDTVSNAYRVLAKLMKTDFKDEYINMFPRLEAILEIVSKVYGVEALQILLSDLVSAASNDLHRFFAEHLELGGRHITANFDCLIEKVMNFEYRAENAVNHFHGSFGDASIESFSQLGATLSNIEYGFDSKLQNRLIDDICSPDTKVMVVVGYSGADYFDMNPFVRNNLEFIENSIQNVVWVEHSTDNHAIEGMTVPVEQHINELFDVFNNSKIKCTLVRCPTRDYLNALSQMWDIPLLGNPPKRNGSRGGYIPKFCENIRLETTRRLYLHLGMYRDHDVLVKAHPEVRNNVNDHESAEVAWQLGKHSQAYYHWSRLYPDNSHEHKARRLERKSACLWDRGALLRAYWNICNAYKHAALCDNSEVTAICLETKARILIKIAATHDLRWFPTGRKVTTILRLLRRATADDLTTHLRVRLWDVVNLLEDLEIGNESGETGSTSLSSALKPLQTFREYASLSAYLDYSRGLRRRLANLDSSMMSLNWLEAYTESAALLGKTNAIASLPVLPGAAKYFSMNEGLNSLLQTSATLWHKVRLISLFIRNKNMKLIHKGI